MLTAITTCTKNASAVPSHTENGRPRDAITSDANMRLVGQLADEDGREDRRDDREPRTRYSIGTTGRAFASSWWRYSLMP